MPREDESLAQRRLTTPERREERSSRELDRRSRSRTRRESQIRRSRSRIRTPRRSRDDAGSLHSREIELEQERERLRLLEDQLRRDRHQFQRNTLERETYRRRDRREQRQNESDQTEHRARSRQRSTRREYSPVERRSRGTAQRGDNASAPREPRRSVTPTFSTRDVVNILNSVKSQPQPSTVAPTQSSGLSHKNILPDFDPSSKSQTTDVWLRKVNECATVYGWDERTVIHFAMQKLQGLAKTWYESLNSILYSWSEWQQKLISAFPFEQNYGQSLEDMLKRKSRYNEPLEIYYYEKLALLNRCDIEGKRAVDCIIHGLTDKTIRSSANALRCTQPEQLLQFLMASKEVSNNFVERNSIKGRPTSDSNNTHYNYANKTVRSNNNPVHDIFCFNCKEKGHPYLKCPKPLIQCVKCRRFGHKSENCIANNANRSETLGKSDSVPAQKTMRIGTTEPNSKFIKEGRLNDVAIKSFIDFGSEVTLLTLSAASSLGLTCNKMPTPLKGFGNNIVQSHGGVDVDLNIDGVNARVECQVVDDALLDLPLLVGQTFTEQPHVVVYKNVDDLRFYDVNLELPPSLPDKVENMSVTVKVLSDLIICGPATLKVQTNDLMDGNVLLSGRVIGKPTQEFKVSEGVYPVKQGMAYVSVTPLAEFCLLREGSNLARGTKVHVVKRISTSRVDIHVEESAIDVKQVHIGNTVDEAHVKRLLGLLEKFKHCFASCMKELGCTNVAEMHIELNSTRPVVYRPYRLSHTEREQVRDMVGEMMEAGIIRESTSEYASPIILVRKKDGKHRLCVDYRLLNSVTVKERYPMPVIEDEIARLSGQAYFITLDLASGYYQVPISEDSKPLTSFVTPDGQYEFNRMPFGLANAPAVFQRMMNKVLGSARFSEATAYIDDVLIYGKSAGECLDRLEKVLELIERANLTLNLSKCNFLQDKILYLGYEISVEGVRPGDKKIKSVEDFPCPNSVHSVRQFLGLVGYFRKFIRNFATLAHPLNKLLKKDAEFVWGQEQDRAFRDLKDKLIHRPILTIYDPNAETELHTDASKVGIGGILMQRSGKDGPFQPVAFYSRQNSPEERNFHAFELETLAVVCSLKKFRVYLLGKKFRIVTDCSALRSTFSKRDLIPRVARWWLLLQEFDCAIEYRPGTKMTHVDALSRNPVQESENFASLDQYPGVMSITSHDWLHTLQLGDTELRRIRDILMSNMDTDGLNYIKDNYVMRDDKLYRCIDGDKENLRWVVPKGARWQLCRLNHDEIGHFGVEKTLERIKKSYWFPKMSKFVKKYVQACIECAYAKKINTREGLLHPIEKVEVPFHTLHIDHLGPFVRSKRGNSYLLVIVDSFTKFVFIKPVRNTKSLTTIKVLEDIFYTFRNPDRIISDRGTSFTSHTFKRFCVDKGIKHVLNAVASPRSNGQVERYNRTILNSLKAQNLNYDEKDWDDKVGKVQWGINNTCHKTTGRTPAEVMFGVGMNAEINPSMNEIVNETREQTDLLSIRENVKDRIDEQQVKQKESYDKNRRPAKLYNEGDLVKITRNCFSNDGKSKKLLSPYIGPYRVTAVLGNDRYRVAAIPGLTSSKNKRNTTVASDRMLPWVHIAALNVNDCDDNSGSDDEREL